MFSNDSERREQVSIALSSVNYRKVYSSHLKKSHFIEDVFFYLKNEGMASPKIEITCKSTKFSNGSSRNLTPSHTTRDAFIN